MLPNQFRNPQNFSPQSNQLGIFEKEQLIAKINSVRLPQETYNKLMALVERVDKLVLASNYAEYESIENYINWLIKIPFEKYTEDDLDLSHIKEVLDDHHYGLESIKNKILEYMAVIKMRTTFLQQDTENTPKMASKTPIMLFIGIQGIGKTTMVKSVAKALGRQFVRISLGGMSNVRELRGLARGFPESEPGQIIKALISAQTMNPVILLDEMDKISQVDGVGNDIMASLLEILDPEQNYAFTDRYIDHPIDLSQVFFICTANNLGGISSALLDRLELIRFSSYTDEDKKQIAKNYLLPKVRTSTGLMEEHLQFRDDVWDLIVRPLGFDAGIRELERTLVNVARQVARKIVEGKVQQVVITPENFRQYIPEDFGIYT